nr:hypothetical protein [Actinoplanes solisilvae]
MATLDGEVVNAEHRDVTGGRVGRCTNQPKESIAARRHAQRRGQPGTRPAGERESDRRKHPPQSFAHA